MTTLVRIARDALQDFERSPLYSHKGFYKFNLDLMNSFIVRKPKIAVFIPMTIINLKSRNVI